MPAYKSKYARNMKVALVRSGISDEAFDANVETLLEDASGGRISESDSDIYAIESLDALKSVRFVGPQAYQITDAESTLVDAARAERQDMTKMMVAEILSYMDSLRSAGTAGCGAAEAGMTGSNCSTTRRLLSVATVTAELSKLIESSTTRRGVPFASLRRD